MKVSIITVSYNSSKTISDTIGSILNQTYKDIEYIIVDGNSTDSTLSIIKGYEQAFNGRLTWKSEPDKGLYDAMNKGISLASGEIIAILNSDDIYSDNYVIEKVVNKMGNKVDCLYSDLQFVDQNDTSKVVRKWKAGTGKFKLGWNPPHPTTFLKKSLYEQFGMFKINYRIASDYDLLYRIMNNKEVSAYYLEENLVKMRMGGESTSGIKSTIKANREVYTSLKENRAMFPMGVLILRLLRKAKQVI